MKDFIPNGTGNSRYMKSSVPSGTTWEQALAMLRAGTFPFDLNGVNASGVAQMGTPLNKASLLQDSTASALGLSGDPTVNDALSKIDSLIGSLDSEVSSYAPTDVLLSTTTSSTSKSVRIDLPSMNIGDYSFLYLHTNCPSTSYTFRLRANGETTGTFYRESNLSSATLNEGICYIGGILSCMVAFPIMKDPSSLLMCFHYGIQTSGNLIYNCFGGSKEMRFSDIDYLTITSSTSSDKVPARTKITILGVK